VVQVLDAKGVVEPYREPGQGRGWLTLLLGLIVFAAFGGVVGYAYLNGLPGVGGEPPLIRAAAEPYRYAPNDRGGLEVANASSSIVSVLRPQNEGPRVERLLPPEPELGLESVEPEAEAAPAAEPTPRPVPSDTAALAPAPLPDKPAAAPDEPVGADTGAATTVLVPPAKPEPPVQLAAREPPATIGALPRQEPALPAPVEPQPARPPAPPTPARATTAPVAPEAVAAPLAPGAGPQRLVRADPAAPVTSQRASAGAGIYRLQLTAVRSESGLTRAWADLRDRYPTALAAVSPQVERTQTSSGPLFRLQAGPFADREAAANACVTIRSTGGQCFIVGPIAP
jgi:hypothetical protein